MKKIKWWLETRFVEDIHKGEFEVENGTPEEEIEELAKCEAFNCISWGYEEVNSDE